MVEDSQSIGYPSQDSVVHDLEGGSGWTGPAPSRRYATHPFVEEHSSRPVTTRRRRSRDQGQRRGLRGLDPDRWSRPGSSARSPDALVPRSVRSEAHQGVFTVERGWRAAEEQTLRLFDSSTRTRRSWRAGNEDGARRHGTTRHDTTRFVTSRHSGRQSRASHGTESTREERTKTRGRGEWPARAGRRPTEITAGGSSSPWTLPIERRW